MSSSFGTYAIRANSLNSCTYREETHIIYIGIISIIVDNLICGYSRVDWFVYLDTRSQKCLQDQVLLDDSLIHRASC